MSGERLREILLAASKLVQSIDATWHIEISFVAYMTGSGGVEELQSKIIKEFPTGGNPSGLTMEGVGLVLKNFGDKPGFRFYSRAAQARGCGRA